MQKPKAKSQNKGQAPLGAARARSASLPLTGQAALIAVILMLFIMLSAVFGASSVALKEAKVATENTRSRYSFFAAEAGIDDAAYRLKRGKNLTSSFTILLNGATANIVVTTSGQTKEIKSTGDYLGATRAAKAALSNTTGASFYYGVQVGDGGLDMGNSSRVNGNVFSNGNITGGASSIITGDAVVAGGISLSPSVEWTAHDSDQFFATASSNHDIAQSFIANVSDRLNKTSVYLGKVGSPAGDITLRIAADYGGNPYKSSIASATIRNSMIGATPGWIDASFSSPPNLTTGSKYWIVLDTSTNSSSNYWNWRKDSADGYLNNTAKYTSDCCGGNPTWTNVGGDLAFKVWIGGVSTKIEGITIGDATSGTGRANLFVNTTIHGSACPNEYCVIDNPAREELPISDGVIQDWKNAALAGGTCGPPTCSSSGDLSLNMASDSISLGPIYIPGDLSINNEAILTITGTIWIGGTASFNNTAEVRLDSSYGALSGVMVADGDASVNNGAIFSGSGDPNSYFMLTSAQNDQTGIVIDVNNDALGVIYYANHGKIKFNNDAAAKEATAYGIILNNEATITYESGLANVNFYSGPSGGWNIESWAEVVP